MWAAMEPGVHTMSYELMLQISCNIFLAFKWISMMTSGQNISHYMTTKLSVHVWNYDLIWWQNKIDTQKHFHKTTMTSSWTLSKTKIPITIVKGQMPSNPNQKSRTRDNDPYYCSKNHEHMALPPETLVDCLSTTAHRKLRKEHMLLPQVEVRRWSVLVNKGVFEDFTTNFNWFAFQNRWAFLWQHYFK